MCHQNAEPLIWHRKCNSSVEYMFHFLTISHLATLSWYVFILWQFNPFIPLLWSNRDKSYLVLYLFRYSRVYQLMSDNREEKTWFDGKLFMEPFSAERAFSIYPPGLMLCYVHWRVRWNYIIRGPSISSSVGSESPDNILSLLLCPFYCHICLHQWQWIENSPFECFYRPPRMLTLRLLSLCCVPEVNIVCIHPQTNILLGWLAYSSL